jgi:hypothetical protein
MASGPLGRRVASLCVCYPVFRDNVLVSLSSGVVKSFLDFTILAVETITLS